MEVPNITYLFDKIEITNSTDYENLLDNLNRDQALYMIYSAIEKSHANGVFNLSETELVSKSLRLLNKKIDSQETDIKS